MRSVLTLSLLIALCASANAATVHRTHRQHPIARSTPGVITGPVSGFAYAPAGPPVRYRPAPYDQPNPVYDDPHKNWGG